jgi:hypothetical protein
MTVLIIVAVVCFVAGTYASSRWLPELAPGPVGTIAFFVVCGLSGAALGLVGINIDQLVRGLEESEGSGRLRALIVSNGLTDILRDAGTIAGLALIGYLLAPKAPRERAREDI